MPKEKSKGQKKVCRAAVEAERGSPPFPTLPLVTTDGRHQEHGQGNSLHLLLYDIWGLQCAEMDNAKRR